MFSTFQEQPLTLNLGAIWKTAPKELWSSFGSRAARTAHMKAIEPLLEARRG